MEEKSLKERMKEITDVLEKGIRDVFDSGTYEAYLKTMSRFHNYSMNNTMLIYLQKPDATRVAGYQAWQRKFHRSVRKGEKGIRILAPCPFKKTVPDEDSPDLSGSGANAPSSKIITVPAFRPVTVFDVSQTSGQPLPELVHPLKGDVEGYRAFHEALQNVSPVPIIYEDLPSDMDGFYSRNDKAITIRKGMSEVQTVSALVHEIAHARLHDALPEDPGEWKDGRTMEVEAESVSYAVCSYYGIETGENSFGYIASWSKDKDLPELKNSLSTIVRASSGLITEIDRAREELAQSRLPSMDELLAAFPDIPVEVVGNGSRLGKEACL